jgi:hypothetical protein
MSTFAEQLDELIKDAVGDIVDDKISDASEDFHTGISDEIDNVKYECEQMIDSNLADIKEDILSELSGDVELMVNEAFAKKMENWSGFTLSNDDRRWIGDLITATIDERLHKTLTKLVDDINPNKHNYHNIT